MPAAVAIAAASPPHERQAAELAERLRLPLVHDAGDSRFAFLLVVTARGLELRDPAHPKESLYIDFLSGPLAYRRRFGGGRRQPLARAVGLTGGVRPSVVDATAGLGRDAFVLAGLGCDVRMVERSPIVGALLQDGLDRAARDPALGPLLQARLRLEVGDSRAVMARLDPRPEVVYLDPLYPPRGKTALVKKDMRMLRALVGADEDAASLLEAALLLARRRVVVKRPRFAPALTGPPPSHSVSAENTRFDVYLSA